MDAHTERLYTLLEHQSNWSEVRAALYEVVNDPDFHDAEMYKRVADVIDRQVAKAEVGELQTMNDIYPAMVQVLHALVSMKAYADRKDYQVNVNFLKALLGSV